MRRALTLRPPFALPAPTWLAGWFSLETQQTPVVVAPAMTTTTSTDCALSGLSQFSKYDYRQCTIIIAYYLYSISPVVHTGMGRRRLAKVLVHPALHNPRRVRSPIHRNPCNSDACWSAELRKSQTRRHTYLWSGYLWLVLMVLLLLLHRPSS